MRIPAFPGFVLAAAAAAVPAQTYDASPKGLLSSEGTESAWYTGGYTSSRNMFLDGELRGKAGVVKEVAFRVDYRSHVPFTEMGRLWSKVTVKISDCDLSNSSATFSSNPTSTPSLVFSGAMAWPTLNGFPSSQPAVFGHETGRLAVPFTSAWAYGGSTDICLDFDFDGGTLANATAWSAGVLRNYYLDGYGALPDVARGNPTRLGKSLDQKGCVSAGAYNGLAGYANLDTSTFALSSPVHPGKSVLHVTTIATTSNKPVAITLAAAGFPAGVQFPGVTCNLLYADLGQPHLILVKQAQAPAGLTNFDLAVFDYIPALAGVPMYLQAAWNDPISGAVLLTNASRNAIPLIPQAPLRKCVFTSVVANKNTTGSVLADPAYNPILRYAR